MPTVHAIPPEELEPEELELVVEPDVEVVELEPVLLVDPEVLLDDVELPPVDELVDPVVELVDVELVVEELLPLSQTGPETMGISALCPPLLP